MQEVKGITILDAFKALDEIDDEVIKDEVKKVSRKKRIKESLKEDKKVIKLDISGDNMYDKGQAYYYARTGDHIDYSGKKYEIAQDDTHKIGYSDTILLKGEDGKTIEVSKKDFIRNATLLKECDIKEAQEDYWVLSDGENPNHSQVFDKIDDLDEFIKKLEAGKGKGHWELLHYVNSIPKKVWDTENGKVEESCKLKEEPKYEMSPEYDSRKSFYGKAKVDERPDGSKVLYSYGTPVCMIKDGKATLLKKGYLGWASSQTTLRHVKEFLKQNGFEAGSINDLRKNYPIEQFHEDLNEGMLVDVFDKEQAEKGREFIDEDNDEHIEQVVDVDAETVEELKDSYVGNVLLRCPVCKTPLFKKPELLEKDPDSDIYNVGETCPHCGSKDGFELVGQIATLDIPQEEPAPTTGKDEIETTSATVEDEITNNEVGGEESNAGGELTQMEKEDENTENVKADSFAAALGMGESFDSKKNKGKVLNEAIVPSSNNTDDYQKQILNTVATRINNTSKNLNNNKVSVLWNDQGEGAPQGISVVISQDLKQYVNEATEIVKKVLNSIGRKLGNVSTNDWGDTISIDFELPEFLNYGENKGNEDGSNQNQQTAQLKVAIFLNDNFNAPANLNTLPESIKKILENLAAGLTKQFSNNNLPKGKNTLGINWNEQTQQLDVGYSDSIVGDANTIQRVVLDLLKKEGCEPTINSIRFKSNEGGFIVVTNILRKDQETVKVPGQGQTQQGGQAVMTASYEKKPSTIIKESKEINGLSEDTFNTLVNKYLEATYNNVESYSTTSCDLKDNKLIIEGVIKFKSGKAKETAFVLESKETKSNKLRFVGMNETFSKSKRTFNLVCSNDRGNLVCESLSYGYKANEKEVKGKVKVK